MVGGQIPTSSEQIKQSAREFLKAHFNTNDWYLGSHVNRLCESLARSAPYIQPNDRILEAGSYGHIPLLLWRLFGLQSVYAFSLEAGYIGYGHGALRPEGDPLTEFQCKIEAVNIERDHWPRSDDSLDVVLCFEVLEHLREHPSFMLAEANRVLKDGGYFILTTPNSSSYRAIINILYRENPYLYSVYGAQRVGMGHIKEYAVNELELLLKYSGFEIVTHATFSPYQDEKDQLFPELRKTLNHFGFNNELSGSTHFLVARKINPPRFEYYQPLYDTTSVWNPDSYTANVLPEDEVKSHSLILSDLKQASLPSIIEGTLAKDKIAASIIIPIEGEWEDIPPCIDALFDPQHLLPKLEIIFVPFQLGMIQLLRLKEICQLRQNTRIISSDPSNNFAQVLNLAVQTAQGEQLIFVDSRCRPKSGWTAELLEAASQGNGGIFGAKMVFPPTEKVNLERIYSCGIVFDAQKHPQRLYQYCLTEQPFTAHAREVQAVDGYLTLIRREVLASVGGFSEGLSRQDLFFDLCCRARTAGYTVHLVPTCEAYIYPSENENDTSHIPIISAEQLSKWGDLIHVDELDHYRCDGLALGPTGCIRVAMVAPLAPQKTGVADYVTELLPSLSKWITLDLFVDGYVPSNMDLLKRYPVRLISDLEAYNGEREYDQIIYHIGNNKFHSAIYQTAARTGGIVVVHEYDCLGCIRGSDDPISTSLDEIRERFDESFYLAANPDVAAAINRGEFSSAWDHFVKHGFMEKRIYSHEQGGFTSNKALWQNLFINAAGVVVHNEHTRSIFQAEYPDLPVAVIPHLLSPDTDRIVSGNISLARQKLGVPDGMFVIVSLGFIQPHKRNHTTVRAFARFARQHPNSLLVLAGEATDEHYCANLENTIRRLGIQDRVRLTGWLSEEAFFDWIAAGNVMVNLRYPSRGEDSGTLTRILGSGKPAVVSDYAQFADIPDECVIKIPFNGEIERLEEALNSLAQNNTLRDELAQNAYQYYRTHNAVEKVAKAYATFCENIKTKPGHRYYDYPPETKAQILWETTGWTLNDPGRELALAVDRSGIPIHISTFHPFNNQSGFNPDEIKRFQQMESIPLEDDFIQVYCGSLGGFKRHHQSVHAIVMTDHHDETIMDWQNARVDEFWVPSTYCREQLLLMGIPAGMIHVIPFGVSTLAYGTTIRQLDVKDTFTFLATTDWSNQDAWVGILSAFLEEFGGEKNIKLHFRLSPSSLKTVGRDEAFQQLAQFAQKHPGFKKGIMGQVVMESQLVEQDEVPLIYARVDGYVHVHPDSAFGRSLLEAMAVGLPVITLDRGGQCDFATNDNAYLIDCHDKQGRLTFDKSALRARMREVINDSQKAEAVGISARNTALNGWTWKHAANHAAQRLEAIYGYGTILTRQRISSPRAAAQTGNTTSISPASAQPFGFNVIGYISGNLGIGVTARNVIRVLLDRGYPVKLLDLDPGLNRYRHDNRFITYTVSSPDKLSYPINLIILPPADLCRLAEDRMSRWLSRSHLNVAWSMWELPEIPPVWCKQMEFVDVLVAESQFILQSFNHSLPEHETMMAVHPLYLPDIVDSQRSHFGLPEDVFLFVTSFEPHSDIQRKNPAMVLEAFRRAFNQDDHVNLVIKINNPGSGNLVHPFVKQLKREFGDSKKIHIIAESLSYNEVISLYDCCDAYISLHRSEGLGLGIMEAMMLGKAVIATGWSGNMTYMNESNSCPVKYRLVPVAGSTPAYQKELIGREMVWADPDIDDVVAWMQRLVNEPSLRMELGQKAYKDMHEWHAEACKGEFADALQYLWQTRIAKENEQKAYRKWLGWRIEGWELFYEARNYRFSWKQLTEFSWPRSKARGKAVARKILHFAQKTSLGQYLIEYLYNKRIIHSLQF